MSNFFFLFLMSMFEFDAKLSIEHFSIECHKTITN